MTRVLFLGFVLLAVMPAHAHDRLHPQYDDWYGSLQRPGVSPSTPYGVSGCCGKTDCHTTEAELRGDDWWAKVGIRDEQGNWTLLEFVKIPTTAVLLNQSNPTGEAVICHAVSWQDQRPNPSGMTVWCFVPPEQV